MSKLFCAYNIQEEIFNNNQFKTNPNAIYMILNYTQTKWLTDINMVVASHTKLDQRPNNEYRHFENM